MEILILVTYWLILKKNFATRKTKIKMLSYQHQFRQNKTNILEREPAYEPICHKPSAESQAYPSEHPIPSPACT